MKNELTSLNAYQINHLYVINIKLSNQKFMEGKFSYFDLKDYCRFQFDSYKYVGFYY